MHEFATDSSLEGVWIRTIGPCREASRFILRKANSVGIERFTKEICGVPTVRIHLPPAVSLRTSVPLSGRCGPTKLLRRTASRPDLGAAQGLCRRP
jgi:hypothetical protein